jgi:hypothetical protein
MKTAECVNEIGKSAIHEITRLSKEIESTFFDSTKDDRLGLNSTQQSFYSMEY